jgi:hypothetical protein
VVPNLVIRTGTASLEVDSLEQAIALARALAHRVGGFVAGSAAQTGKGQLHSASLEIRMPAERFDDAVVVAGTGWWVVRRARKPAPPRPAAA